ncbi:TIGR03915 family putative DNA repair protein [Aurantibacter crassamenti]|uniref:TIGR03915 family putative DNA repair protein n=1 Tax=Aurantibacter crassamenti TaxID=1837375 RepID=UPI0019397634|nr:TIGR03915 family putative DNA repair protein [Aurantibacter crassamenti]MBM1107244.1 TIGR03915 family putative DNA repair protein [Aurantibacter crassamenti]
MADSRILIYDGSFNGFLTTVFMAFELNMPITDIQKNSTTENGLFVQTKTIFTNLDKAKRVWNGVQKKSNTAIKNIYFAFQSESKGIELILYKYIRNMYDQQEVFPEALSNPIELKIELIAKNVSREKQRVEAFARFQNTQDHIKFINLEPNFDILPLISKHYRSKYNEQEWLIYDIKRNYGIFYDLEKVEIISLDLQEFYSNNNYSKGLLSELDYNSLEVFDNYFKSTSVKALINKKLLHQKVSEPKHEKTQLKREAV